MVGKINSIPHLQFPGIDKNLLTSQNVCKISRSRSKSDYKNLPRQGDKVT